MRWGIHMFTSTLLRLCSCVPLTGDTLWETVFVTNTAAILSILNIYPAVEESISSTSCRHFLGMRLFGKGCVHTYYLIRSSQEAPKSATGHHGFKHCSLRYPRHHRLPKRSKVARADVWYERAPPPPYSPRPPRFLLLKRLTSCHHSE